MQFRNMLIFSKSYDLLYYYSQYNYNYDYDYYYNYNYNSANHKLHFLFPTVCLGLTVSVRDEFFGNRSMNSVAIFC